MTLPRKAVSAFLVWHLTAIGIASLPSNASISTPIIAAPVRAYISLTGQAQQWAMFSSPPHYDTYWRVRYYIQPANGRPWIATELVGPAHREDRIRLAQSFRDSYQDKALELALDAFYKRRKPVALNPGTRPGQLPDDLAPVGRYFARRFARERLRGTDERIVRTEIWVGLADNKEMGSPIDWTALAERRAVLSEFAGGPVENRLRVPPYPPYHGVDEEVGIRWVLEYFEEP